MVNLSAKACPSAVKAALQVLRRCLGPFVRLHKRSAPPSSLATGRQCRYSFYTMSPFEFDAAKSESNRAKHGIDFVLAQSLWNDPMLLEVPAKTDDEPRFLVIGQIDGKHWSAVITYRGSNVRLISVRRARTEEVALYES